MIAMLFSKRAFMVASGATAISVATSFYGRARGAESIKLGAALSQTGRFSDSAKYMQEGYQLWVDEANRRGGIAGRPVDVIIYDDESNPDSGRVLAERLIDRFLTIWKDHTQLETFFTFGNHDLVGTRNPSVERSDPRYGKGLYRMRLGLDRNYYAFERRGWRFIILDDVLPQPDGSYIGALAYGCKSMCRC